MAEVARESNISVKVIQDYFVILEDLLLAVRLPVLSKKAKRRLIAHPKFLFFDSGIHAFELKHADRVGGEDTTSLKLFLHDYPSAKCHLLYLGNEEYHEDGVSVIPLETALRTLVSIVG